MTLLTTKCRSAVARRLLPQAWALAPAALLIPFFVQSACLGQPAPASEGAEFGTAFGETRDLLPGTAVPQAAIANETEPLGSGSAANPALAVADETAAARSAGLGPREPVAMPAAGSEGVVGLSAAPAPILTGKPARIGVLDVLGKLAIVAALVYVSVFGLRSVWQRRLGPAPAGRDLRVRERASLGGSRCLYLVEAGVKLMLIGADGSHITLLADLDSDGNGAQEGENDWSDEQRGGRSHSSNGSARTDADQLVLSAVGRARKKELLLDALRRQRA